MKRAVLAALAACGGAPAALPPITLAHSPPVDLSSGAPTAVVEQGDAVYALAGKIATIEETLARLLGTLIDRKLID